VLVVWDTENTTVYLGQRAESLQAKRTETDSSGQTTMDTWCYDSKITV